MSIWCITAAVLGVVLAAAQSGAGETAMQLPPHPRLLLNAEGIARVKERIGKHEWAAAEWKALLKRADAALGKPVDLPPRGGNWTHWYACPKHGCALQTGEKIGDWQWEHRCPIGGESLRSDISKASKDYDACVISGIHGNLSRSVRDLGLAWQLSGKQEYARKARDILVAYARVYANYPLHNVHGEAKVGGGRKGAQTLDESVWLIPTAQGADLIWDTLTEAERDLITTKLLLPAVDDVILPHKMGIHNIQCWKNSAVGLVGLLLGDARLVDNAINDPERGYRVQMAKGVRPDGLWWEGSWGYHFYTISALWPLTEAARNCGIDLYGPEYRKMFLAPVRFAMPNMRLPSFSDSAEVSLEGQPTVYELAYARYREPSFLQVLSRSKRDNESALWFGVDDLPAAKAAKAKSENFTESGLAVLAEGDGTDATWLGMRYGPHGGGHGHPDKLSFVLYAHGEVVGIDPGLARYGLPIYQGWYRTSIAHNTLVLDEESQQPADGECLAFGSQDGAQYACARVRGTYKDTQFVRAVTLVDKDLLVVVDQVRSDRKRLMDIAWHQKGTWADTPLPSPWTPPDKPGYSYLRGMTTRSFGGPFTLECQVGKNWKTAISLWDKDPGELMVGTGVGLHAEDRVPVAIFRRKANETSFVWSVALGGKAPHIDRLHVLGLDGSDLADSQVVALRISHNGKSRHLLVNPDGREAKVLMPVGPEWRSSKVIDLR